MNLCVDSKSVNFKSYKRKTQNGNEYYHSNKALITGSLICATATGLLGLGARKQTPKAPLVWFGLTAPMVIIGAIADKLTNKEQQKAADLVADYGIDIAQQIDHNIEISKEGIPSKSDYNGTKVGLIGAAGIMCLSTLSHLLAKKCPSNKFLKNFGYIYEHIEKHLDDFIMAPIAILFPFVLPVIPFFISDWLNNKQIEKHL